MVLSIVFPHLDHQSGSDPDILTQVECRAKYNEEDNPTEQVGRLTTTRKTHQLSKLVVSPPGERAHRPQPEFELDWPDGESSWHRRHLHYMLDRKCHPA